MQKRIRFGAEIEPVMGADRLHTDTGRLPCFVGMQRLAKERQIEPHIPDAERNYYTCPQGRLLVQFRRTYGTPRSGITRMGRGYM